MKLFLAAAASACVAAYIWVYATGLAPTPIRADGFTYYVYLPSWFLYHDATLASVADDCCGGEFPDAAIIRWPGTRRWVNAHPIGVAVMQAPFFAIAHALTRWSNLTADGFTMYYQHAAGLAGLVWSMAGLWILGIFLRRHFSVGVAIATLATILFGTNLFHYSTFDSTYSHAFSFFLFAAFLALADRWEQDNRLRTTALAGVTAALIVLVRHPNVLLLVCFAPWFLRDVQRAAAMGAVFLLAIAPQLAIYYQATGRPIVSSYGELGFDFASPRLFGVLFSPQKGLFFWSPLLLLACAGFVLLARSGGAARRFVVPCVAFLVIDTYVIASWWDWQFGGSFGHRGFADTLPLFALGLAAFYQWTRARRARYYSAAVVVCLAVALNLFQSAQYWNHLLPISDITWEQYRAAFLRWH